MEKNRDDMAPPLLVTSGAKPRISSEFGPRNSPISGKPTLHTGIDVAGVEFQRVIAVEDGTVTVSQRSNSAGEWVILKGKSGRRYEYMHLMSRIVSAGAKVKKGEPLGLSGKTGNVTGPHLHFEVRIVDPKNPRGKPVDPREYFGTFWTLEADNG